LTQGVDVMKLSWFVAGGGDVMLAERLSLGPFLDFYSSNLVCPAPLK